MGLLYERHWLLGHPRPLFIVIVSLGLTYQVRIMTLASTVFKNSTFQKTKKKKKKKNNLNALGSKFGLEVM